MPVIVHMLTMYSMSFEGCHTLHFSSVRLLILCWSARKLRTKHGEYLREIGSGVGILFSDLAPLVLLQACTFKPEQLSVHKANRGRALMLSGVYDDSASSCASAPSPALDVQKYEASSSIPSEIQFLV